MATPSLGIQNFFSTTLSGTITASDTTIYLNSVPTPDEGYLVIDLDNSSKEIIYYTSKGANYVTCPSAAAGRGVGVTSAVGHSSGASVRMTVVGEYWEAIQDGSAFDTGSIGAAAYADGWTPLVGTTPNTVTYNGNRNYSLVFNAVDLTGYISPGMRLRATRTVTAPTQCTDLESSSSHYYSKSSPSAMTFTDDFVVSAWVKLESQQLQVVASRYNGTSGWDFYINANGQVVLGGYNGGSSNSSQVVSYTTLPLGKWVHIAAQLDMSTFTATTTTSYIMIDGVDVPAVVTRGGTNPTALVQAGNLEIGGRNGGLLPFDGKIAQVAIYNAKVTQANVAATIPQTLSGSETSLISAYSFNNTINDLSANANNLTAQNSAVATNVDSPFAGGPNASTAYTAGTREYGEVFNITFSTNTTVVVQVPDGYALPVSGGISALSYSTSERPLGWPGRSLVLTETLAAIDQTTNSNGANADINGLVTTVYVPPGRAVRIRAELTISTAAASSLMALRLYEGSTFLIDDAVQQPTSGLRNQIITEGIFWPSAGSHTYKGVFYTNQNANSSLYGAGNVSGGPTRLTVELL